MSPSHIHGNERANRYLAGTLTEAEREAFESDLVKSGGTLPELEATLRLKAGLARLRADGEIDELLRPDPAWWQRPAVAAAAALLAVLVVGVLSLQLGGEPPALPMLAASASSLLDRNGTALRVTRTVAVFRKRAQGYDATIEAARAPEAVQLRVLPEAASPGTRYGTRLSRLHDGGSGEPLASIDNLQPETDGFVTLYVDTSRLTPGIYQLDLVSEPSGSSQPAGTYRIAVK
jgi:hypothetical protein